MASAEYRVVWPFHPSSAVGAPSAGVGEAVPLGPLSVPPAWTTSISEVTSAAPLIVEAAVSENLPGRTFQRALMATMTGRDASHSCIPIRSREQAGVR
ncbi:hypothetical protein [Mycobacterium sp. ACS4054]|uniref:PPE family protein, SVP subgroup n=1 Tax=Mycobacterium sp. ACS4054 TaxID=1834119 RepID=UPI0009EDEEB6